MNHCTKQKVTCFETRFPKQIKRLLTNHAKIFSSVWLQTSLDGRGSPHNRNATYRRSIRRSNLLKSTFEILPSLGRKLHLNRVFSTLIRVGIAEFASPGS